MSAKPSIWLPYQSKLPTESTPFPHNAARINMQALVLNSISLLPYPPVVPRGWAFENSVARGEAGPGIAAAPARVYLAKSNGNASQWVRIKYAYNGDGNVKQAIVHYSNDNEATYVPMLDEDGNYVLQVYHSGSLVPQFATWGHDETISGS